MLVICRRLSFPEFEAHIYGKMISPHFQSFLPPSFSDTSLSVFLIPDSTPTSPRTRYTILSSGTTTGSSTDKISSRTRDTKCKTGNNNSNGCSNNSGKTNRGGNNNRRDNNNRRIRKNRTLSNIAKRRNRLVHVLVKAKAKANLQRLLRHLLLQTRPGPSLTTPRGAVSILFIYSEIFSKKTSKSRPVTSSPRRSTPSTRDTDREGRTSRTRSGSGGTWTRPSGRRTGSAGHRCLGQR